jgi:hypothetical protein
VPTIKDNLWGGRRGGFPLGRDIRMARTPKALPGKRDVSVLSMNAFRGWLFGVIGISAIFAFQPLYPDFIGPLSNIFPATCAGIAFVSALNCIRRYGFAVKKPFEAVWLSFGIGTGLWVAAEVSWAVYYFVLNVSVPYPSLADFFYVGGYVPMLAGFGLYLGTFSRGLSKKRLGIAILAIGTAVTLALTFILPIELETQTSAMGVFTDMLYPVLDLTLLSVAILSLAIFLGGTIEKWWILVAGAVLLYVVGDELFLYRVATGTYYNGGPSDLVFIIGYLTFALAFYTHSKVF